MISILLTTLLIYLLSRKVKRWWLFFPATVLCAIVAACLVPLVLHFLSPEVLTDRQAAVAAIRNLLPNIVSGFIFAIAIGFKKRPNKIKKSTL